MNIIIYHNNRCSKSRQALALLEQQAMPLTIRHYLNDPLSREELITLRQQLNLDSIRQLMRSKEELYQQLQLDNPALTEEELLTVLANHPQLMERPVVVVDQQAAIGRPLANIEALLLAHPL